jgi:hypothetical protein
MRRMIATAWVLAMMSGGVWASQSTTQSSAAQKTEVQKTNASTRKKTSAKKKTSQPVAPAPEIPAQIMPPVPATLMNSSPVKPQVTMESGLLTIDAPNSTLSDVLSGVRKATGAVIEGAFPTERVSVKLGPGLPDQVLDALLRGTPYDYIILGSLGRQDAVARVMLTPQSSQASAGAGQPQNAAAPTAPQEAVQPPDESMPDRTVPEDAADTTPQPEADQTQEKPAPQQQPQPQDPNQPKTPEQLFKELQQLEQQKQQR